MKKEITWQTDYDGPELWLLNGMQEKGNIIFPQDYLDCILKYQGGIPSLRHLNIENCSTVTFKYLLVFVPFDDLDILDKYNIVRYNISERLFPFALDECNNFLCFDYRELTSNPPIVYWDKMKHPREDSQEALFYVCNSFTELLHILY